MWSESGICVTRYNEYPPIFTNVVSGWAAIDIVASTQTD